MMGEALLINSGRLLEVLMGSQQKQPDFLVGFAYKKDNGYLSVNMGVSKVFHPRTQFNDALIESWPDSCFGQF